MLTVDQPFVYLVDLMRRSTHRHQDVLQNKFVILATITKVIPPLRVNNNKYPACHHTVREVLDFFLICSFFFFF